MHFAMTGYIVRDCSEQFHYDHSQKWTLPKKNSGQRKGKSSDMHGFRCLESPKPSNPSKEPWGFAEPSMRTPALEYFNSEYCARIVSSRAITHSQAIDKLWYLASSEALVQGNANSSCQNPTNGSQQQSSDDVTSYQDLTGQNQIKQKRHAGMERGRRNTQHSGAKLTVIY